MTPNLRGYVLIVLLCGQFSAMSLAQDRAPNVIVIVSDDQGWGDFGSNGNQNLSTTNLDRLAQSGASFERFFVQPVCSPTRAEFLTGRYAFRGGVFSTSAGGERLSLNAPTIADVFSDAGYRTAAFGKWHNGAQYPYHPCGRGFDSFYGFASGHWGNYFDPVLEKNGRLIQGNSFLPDDLTDRTMTFVAQKTPAPFFAYLAFNTPHSPMQVPDKFYRKFENAQIAQRGTLADLEDIPHTRAALAMCENIDFNVGRLLERLEDLHLADNTIVVYFCDNGPNGHRFNGGMKGKKGSTDEGGVRLPLFIRWPAQIQPETTVLPIAGAVDLMPTLIDMADIPFEGRLPLDGITLRDHMVTGDAEIKDRMLLNHWNARVSVRSQQFRLDDRGKLFDMAADPGQSKDVTATYPEIAARMTTAASAWKKEIAASRKKTMRPFTVGYPDFPVTHLPADDAVAKGNIKRSNKYPNCSYFTNWKSVDDQISWPIEVNTAGRYKATVHYSCQREDVGCKFLLSSGEQGVTFTINDAHEPKLRGAKEDRVPRKESYVKDFKAVEIGRLDLSAGVSQLRLQAMTIPGNEAIEFRRLSLELIP